MLRQDHHLQPHSEKGLEFFTNPQSPIEMLMSKETRVSTQYCQVHLGRDVAVLLGICKQVFASDDAVQGEGKRVLDVVFIEQHTSRFEASEAKVRATS